MINSKLKFLLVGLKRLIDLREKLTNVEAINVIVIVWGAILKELSIKLIEYNNIY